MGPWFRVSSKRLEKPGIEPMTPGLEGEPLNNLDMKASYWHSCSFAWIVQGNFSRTYSYKSENIIGLDPYVLNSFSYLDPI